jgi:hypothetical protein
VRVKFTLSPTGSSLPPPSSIKELQSQKHCHQAPIRDTSEPYSSSGLLHTRNEFGHNCQVIHRACSILATAPQAAKVRKPLQCSCRTQKSRGFPGYSSSSFVLEILMFHKQNNGTNNCGTIGLFSLQKTPAHRGRRRTTKEDENESKLRILGLMHLRRQLRNPGGRLWKMLPGGKSWSFRLL